LPSVTRPPQSHVHNPPASHPYKERENKFNFKTVFGLLFFWLHAIARACAYRRRRRRPLVQPQLNFPAAETRALASLKTPLPAISRHQPFPPLPLPPPPCGSHWPNARMASQRSQVFQAFKLSGLTLEAPAARYLLDIFKSHTSEQLHVALDAVLRAVKSLVLSSSVVPLSSVQEACKALENSYLGGDEIDDVMLIGAAECPHLECAAPAPRLSAAARSIASLLPPAAVVTVFVRGLIVPQVRRPPQDVHQGPRKGVQSPDRRHAAIARAAAAVRSHTAARAAVHPPTPPAPPALFHRSGRLTRVRVADTAGSRARCCRMTSKCA
jgi:hypothetical protein